jgi:hypothetical protein
MRGPPEKWILAVNAGKTRGPLRKLALDARFPRGKSAEILLDLRGRGHGIIMGAQILLARIHMRSRLPLLAAVALLAHAPGADAACCYFSAKNADILQPAQKAFITWDPDEKIETFTVQPKFEGNALDFGMVIPTPSQPKLSEMPRDFFKHLAIYTVLKKRLVPRFGKDSKKSGDPDELKPGDLPTIKILEVGVVGSLDYKIIEATRADDLFKWLKDNKYQYAGDEATLNHYIQKKWLFTVMKIDTMQMKRNKDGTFDGEVTPTRFRFATDKLIYPLKITQISVREKTEALFYVQAPFKVDLPGDLTYQYTWVPMLQASLKPKSLKIRPLPGRGDKWLTAIEPQIPKLLERAGELGFVFERGKRPQPNTKGRTPTTIEWARKLTAADIDILQGKAPYNGMQKVADGVPGWVQRHAPEEEVKGLQHLAGHLQAGLFITKFRKIFTRSEMNDDLLIVPARLGDMDDASEYEEILPASPP